MSFKTYFNDRVNEVANAEANREAKRKAAIEDLTKVIYDYLNDENFIDSIKDDQMFILISAEKLGDDNWQKVTNVFGLTTEWGESNAINDVTESLKKYPDLNDLNIMNVARLCCDKELKQDCPRAIFGNYYFGLIIAIK